MTRYLDESVYYHRERGAGEHTVFQMLCSVTQENDSALGTVSRLVENINLKFRQFRYGLLEHLAQTLYRQLEVLLVVLKQLREIVPC